MTTTSLKNTVVAVNSFCRLTDKLCIWDLSLYFFQKLQRKRFAQRFISGQNRSASQKISPLTCWVTAGKSSAVYSLWHAFSTYLEHKDICWDCHTLCVSAGLRDLKTLIPYGPVGEAMTINICAMDFYHFLVEFYLIQISYSYFPAIIQGKSPGVSSSPAA